MIPINKIQKETSRRRTWTTIPLKSQSDAKLLGYDQNLWNKLIEPCMTNSTWEDLGDKEKEAASVLLQRIQSAYESCRQNNFCSFGSNRTEWKELSRKRRNAARVLGYNQNLWDRVIDVEIMDSEWKSLTSKQQKAASILDYTEERWEHSRLVRLLRYNTDRTNDEKLS